MSEDTPATISDPNLREARPSPDNISRPTHYCSPLQGGIKEGLFH